MNLLPGRILVRKDPPEKARITEDGIIIHYPDVEHIYSWIATVFIHEPTNRWLRSEGERLHAKQLILIYKHAGKTLELNGTQFHVVREADVLATIEENDNHE